MKINKEQAQTFKELYNSVKEHHPSIIALNDDMIQKIENELIRSRRTYHTYTYILAALSALFLFATYFPLIFKSYSFISLQVQLSTLLSQRQFIDNHLDMSISATFLFLGTFIYTIVLPNKTFIDFLDKHIPFKMKNLSEFRTIDTGRFTYTVFRLILIYMVLIIPLLYSYSYELIPRIVLDFITTVWLMLPMLLFAAFPTFLFIFIMSLVLMGRVRRASEMAPSAIIDNLVSLIYELDKADDVKFSDKCFKIFLVKSIIKASNLMRRMYGKNTFGDVVSQWSIEQMEKVADNFVLLATWVNFPKSDTLESLKDRVCIYLNIFLSGHYQELLHEDKDYFEDVNLTQPKKYRAPKFIFFISLAAYLALPIIAIIIFVTLFKVDIQPFIQSLLTILYIIWGTLGIIPFAENLSPDAKDFLRDILKSTIGK